jgi:small subunit ribosomal protein S4
VRALELRLDNVVHKMGFADSLKQARQLVTHGNIMLNGRKTGIASAATKPGDVVGWTPKGKKSEYFKTAQANMSSKAAPGWLNVDTTQMTGRVVSPPAVEGPGKFDPAVIVEYYSR